jgi:hypothetical protein
MSTKASLAICCLFFCAMPNGKARIGFSLGTSQREYGSRGTPNNNGVAWKYKGWTITEHYDPQGLCTQIVYAGHSNDFPDRVIFPLLRMNTPAGVSWKEDNGLPGWPGLMRKWHSTEYTADGLMTIHLVAVLAPIFPTNLSNEGSIDITEYSFSVAVSN